MKLMVSLLSLVLFTIAGFGAYWVQQSRDGQKAEIEQLQKDMAVKEKDLSSRAIHAKAEHEKKVKQLSKELEDMKTAYDKLHNKFESLQKTNKALSDQLSAQALSHAKASKKPTALNPNAGAEKDEDKKSEKKSMFSKQKEMMAEMMKNEGMQKMIKAQLKTHHDKMWADFEPDMDPDIRAAFDKLLIEDMLKKSQSGMDFLGLDDEGRKAYFKKQKEEALAKEEQIESILGGAYYESYKEYQKSAGARATLNGLQYYGFNLTDKEKRSALIDRMVAINQEANVPMDGSFIEPEDGEDPVQKSFDVMKNVSKKYYESAADILNEQELKSFKQSLDSQNKMMEMSRKLMEEK